MNRISTGLLYIFLLKTTLAANILYVAPLATPSHYLWNKALSLALVERGHNVTMITHDTEKDTSIKNYTVITMEGLYEILQEYYDFENAMYENVMMEIKNIYDYVKFSCEYDLNTEGLDTLLNYPDNIFDLIIFDNSLNQCFYPLIERFNNPPVVAVTAFLLPPNLAYSFGSHIYTSYMPYYNTAFTNQMSCTERILNFIYTNTNLLYRNLIATPAEYESAKKRFGENIRPFEEVERNISLLLANIDPNSYFPFALPPNIIPVGGLHIKPPQPLPKDLNKILNEAQHGVILFSLGTNIKFHMLRSSQIEALFSVFSKLRQIILWKIDVIPKGLPNNVIVRKWLPQNDLLAHPNIKLFITHSGALSTQEAIYHGVPVVPIPFIVDQYLNSKMLTVRKLGRSLDHENMAAEDVYEAITDVLENPIYRENMKTISKRFRDQPETAMERGIFWIEYLLRHKTAEHLVVPARDMPLYKTANLDVYFIFAIGLFCIYNFIMLILTTIRFILNFIFRGSKGEKTKTE